MSNKGLAARVKSAAARHGITLGTTHVAVQRWLNGRGIQAETAGFVAEALSQKLGRRVTVADAGFTMTNRTGPTGTTAVCPESVPAALHAFDGLTRIAAEEGAQDRTLLTDAEIDSAALTWLISRPDGLPTTGTAFRRIGTRDVAAMRTAAEMFMKLDFLYGGGHGHKALRYYFRHEVLPLLHGQHPEKIGKALFVAAAEITQLLAWTAYDTGSHSVADRYLITTLRLTQAIDDRMLGGRILANMSHQANYLGHYAKAVQLARAAQEGAKGHATPRALAMSAAMEARALASAMDEKGATRAMLEAERHFAKADTADDPEWLAYFDEAELTGEFCHCFRDLKVRSQALHHAERAVAQTDPGYARTLAFCRMVLAQSQLMSGQVEAAVATATLAVEEGDSLQSARFLRYVTDFQAELVPHGGSAVVPAFNTLVTTALTSLEE
ncbi:sporulation protein [Streptacidiphilus sp. ASG 303]|uniref:sporulation protein n=1 Tax=Streptacidiphilus sp. ASG 303 TaxID=2896847 RepID=UPI001E4E6786|nr:sporulation protein [Streptacidiphilus sp. ASG 303]